MKNYTAIQNRIIEHVKKNPKITHGALFTAICVGNYYNPIGPSSFRTAIDFLVENNIILENIEDETTNGNPINIRPTIRPKTYEFNKELDRDNKIGNILE